MNGNSGWLRGVTEGLRDGELAVYCLGVGDAFSETRHNTNLLFVTKQGHLLVDAGVTLRSALRPYSVPPKAINHVLITHTHFDHAGGLPEIVLRRYFRRSSENAGRPVLVVPSGCRMELWERVLRGSCEGCAPGADKLRDFVDLKPLEQIVDKPTQVCSGALSNGMLVTTFATRHIGDPEFDGYVPSYGVIVDNKVAYTGDCRFDGRLIADLAAGVYSGDQPLEAIFHDCSFTKVDNHASYEDLLRLPKAVRKKLYLIHYDDSWPGRAEQASRDFAGLALQQKYSF